VTLLVTGATGFVMSVLVREWLRADPAARVVALDVSRPMRRLNATSSRWPTD